MSDNLTASGGVCAPVSWAFDRNRGPDPVRVERMRKALARALKAHGELPADFDDGLVSPLVERIVAAVVDDFDARSRIEDIMPVIPVKRGGIHYPPIPAGAWGQPPKPSPFYKPRKSGRVAQTRRQFVAWRKRVADARDVYRGRKDAYSESEWEDWRDG